MSPRNALPLGLVALLCACGSSVVGLDAGPGDAGYQDAGNQDAGYNDAGNQDAGYNDAGNHDAGYNDAGNSDAGNQDAGNPDAGARDWTAYPAILVAPQAGELWALSDIHGDRAALGKLLLAAGLVDSQSHWAGGAAVLVVVGDLIDKGPDAVGVIRFIAALQAEAAQAGGRLIVTMGNHEAEFLADPNNSKATASNGFDPELADAGLTPVQTAAGDDDVGAFIRALPFAARVGDWFFAHAGNTGGQTLAQLASALQGGVDASGFGARVLSNSSSILEAKLASAVFWEQSGDPETTLISWAHALGAERLVFGHEPAKVTFADGVKRASDTLFQRYDRVFLIDTGMSVGADDTGGALLHLPRPGDVSSAERVTPDGSHHALVAQ